MEQTPSANAQSGASRSAIPAFDPRDELIAALQAEIAGFRRESEYVKKIIELARLWSDKRATREHLSATRKVIELQREVQALKRQLRERPAVSVVREE